jgi:hypothetical protein
LISIDSFIQLFKEIYATVKKTTMTETIRLFTENRRKYNSQKIWEQQDLEVDQEIDGKMK